MRSLENIDVEHINIDFMPYSGVGTQKGVRFPGHINKWMFIPEDLDPERYVVFSDTDDVIFQKELPEFTYDLYLAAENVLHKETIWAAQIEKYPAFSELMDKDVFNCGTFAMKVKTMYEYRDFMMSFEDGGYRSLGLEQMYFNLFVNRRQDLSRVIDLSIFTPLFRNENDGWVKKDGVWKTNKTISCVHANGDVRLKGLL
jgi:hypothetical protein